MKKRYILSFFTAIAMAFCLAGCQSNAVGTVQTEQTNGENQNIITVAEQVDTTISTENESEKYPLETEFKITECSFEDFTSDVEINDTKLAFPCSYKELNESFSIERPVYWYDEETQKYGYEYHVDYNDDMNIIIEYHSDSSDENMLKADDIYSFSIWIDNNSSYSFKFGRVKSDMAKDDIEKSYGKPNLDMSVNSWYVFDNDVVVLDFDENKNVNRVKFFWK
ncbi:MAG: hypothetical protein J1F11_11000 [Oscillospiraceae bacterium]|nr:hypothetical protein [Oscillospiraceae bacterium]